MRLALADFNLVVYFMDAKFLYLVHHQIFQIYNIHNQLTNSKRKVYLRMSTGLPINEF